MGPLTRNGAGDAATNRTDVNQTRLEAGGDGPQDARQQLLDEEQGLTGTPKARTVRHTNTTREVRHQDNLWPRHFPARQAVLSSAACRENPAVHMWDFRLQDNMPCAGSAQCLWQLAVKKVLWRLCCALPYGGHCVHHLVVPDLL
jgi:hypothetical protein